MTEYWVSVKICQGCVGSTYSRAHKIKGSETFGDLIEQLHDVQKDRVTKVVFTWKRVSSVNRVDPFNRVEHELCLHGRGLAPESARVTDYMCIYFIFYNSLLTRGVLNRINNFL